MTYKKKYHTPEGLKHIWAKHKKALGELEAEDTMPDDKPAPQFTNPPPFNNNEQSKGVNMSDKECLHIVARNERTGDRWQCAQCGKSFDDRDNPAPQFGEPWTYHKEILDRVGHGIAQSECRTKDGITAMRCRAWIDDRSHRDMERAAECVSAMSGIPDPQGFVREVRELLKDCEGYIAEDAETIRANGTRYCNQCGEDDGSSWCSTCRLMRDIRAMLARLDAGRGK